MTAQPGSRSSPPPEAVLPWPSASSLLRVPWHRAEDTQRCLPPPASARLGAGTRGTSGLDDWVVQELLQLQTPAHVSRRDLDPQTSKRRDPQG